MSDDLVSLRMLVVTAAPPDGELWRHAAGLASVPVELSTAEPKSVVGALARDGADICILDADLTDADKTKVIAAARSINPQPLVFMASANAKVRYEGADGTLMKPVSVERARILIETCVRTKIPTRVLVVDDSSTMRSIVRKILKVSRFNLVLQEAAEGVAALEQMRVGKFDMVFLDYNMPGLNGFDTLAEIKRATPRFAVVMMTSTFDDSLAERARSLGAFAFFKKPFYPADIDAMLERFFGLYQQTA
jgi:DNA-binding NtrC family response regulator